MPGACNLDGEGSRVFAARAQVIIIIQRISRAPIYHTRWQHRALYNNTNPTHSLMHAHTHSVERGDGQVSDGTDGCVFDRLQ